MNSMNRTPLEFTTAQLDGYQVSVVQAHRRWTAADHVIGAPESTEYEPVAVTVTAPFRLSLDDVAAVLFWMGCPDGEDFDQDGHVRWLVAETVINAGSQQIEELRCQLDEQTLDTAEAAYLTYCRQRAASVFSAPAAAQPTPQRSRELAVAR